MRKFLLVAFLFAVYPANAALLGFKDIVSIGGGAGIAEGFPVRVDYFGKDWPMTTDFEIVLEIPITPGDSGSILSVNSGAGFDRFAELLTDGDADFYELRVKQKNIGGGGGGSGDFIYDTSTFGGTPDLAGYNIERVDLFVNSLAFESPGYDPNGDGQWTNVEFYGRFEVHGSVVPIPAAACLFGSALVGLGWLRSKR